jgi:uncharacterized protein (TIGR00369 family)
MLMKKPSLFELGRKMIAGEIPPAPVAQLIGFHLVELDSGKAVAELDANERHANPMGTLHGGILCDIADAAMGMAYASLGKEDESFTTIEFKINFFRPVWNSKLRASAEVVRRGQTVGMVQCDITDEKGNLVARASSTCMTLRGEKAQGR